MSGSRRAGKCSHLDEIRDVVPAAHGCEGCKPGAKWVHLRMCLTCGHVGCCDDSEGKHASGHAGASGHPVMRSLEPGEDWGWCFVDEVILKPRRPCLDFSHLQQQN